MASVPGEARQALVRDAKVGDDRAFEALLRPLIDPAYRLACGMLHDSQLAEDAVQDASLKAWRKLHQLREGTDMRPWFMGIVANQCRTVRRGRWWSVLKFEAPEAEVKGPEESLLRGADLRAALRKLSEGNRMAVILHYYLDLPLDEVAAIQGVSLNAVKGRLFRAVRQLRPGMEVPENLR